MLDMSIFSVTNEEEKMDMDLGSIMKAKLSVSQIDVANRLHELFGVTKDQ